MRVLHLLATGEIGGIETLIRNYDEKSEHENVYVFVWGGGTIADSLKERGRKTLILNKTNRQFFSVLSTVLKICKEEKIQLAVVHHESPLLKILLMACRLLRPSLPMVAYAHADAMVICNENKPKGFQIRKWIQRAGFGAASGVIAISRSVSDSLIHILNIPKDKIRILYNGIPIEKFTACSHRQRCSSGTFIFTYVGRLSPEKGADNIIRLFSKLDPEILKRVKLQIVGDGPCREALISLAEEKQLTSKISFLGSCENVAEILGDSHFFIHFPNCKEGFGLAVIEAMAAGNICICLNKGAIPEIIDHGKNGYLLQELSSDELQGILEYLLENYDSEEIETVRKNAIDRAKDFSLEHFSRQFDQYLCDLYDKK